MNSLLRAEGQPYVILAAEFQSRLGDRWLRQRDERKVRTPQDSRLVNDQAGEPDGIVQQRIDSPKRASAGRW